MTKFFSNPLAMLVVGAGLALLALAAYSSAIAGDFIWDDESYVTDNATLTSGDGLERIWFEPLASPQYYPLVFTTFWLEQQLWGFDATGYHVVNVLLHAASAFLLWRLLLRLRVPGALFAALLFLVHPVCVESVAWITERKNVLSMFFMLASASAWFRFRPLGRPRTKKKAEDSLDDLHEDEDRGDGDPQGAFAWYVLTLVLFAGALLSKTVTASLPAAILLVQGWKTGRIRMRDVAFLLPMFAVGGWLGLNTAHLEITHVGAAGPEWDHSPVERILIAGRVPWFYVWKVLVPYPLAFFYTRWAIDTGAWWQYAFPFASVGLVIALWVLRRRLGRGPLVAALYFGGLLLPSSGIADLFPHRYSFVADHFQYHALLGPLILLAAGGALLFADPARRRLGLGIAAGVIVVLGTLTWRQGRIYENLEVLWEDTVERTPTCWPALLSLGQIRFQGGQRRVGLDLLERAEQYAPEVSEAQMTLAQARAETGDVDGALQLFEIILARQSIAIPIPVNIATRVYQDGNRAGGIRLLEGLARLQPSSSLVRARLGSHYAKENRLDEAYEQLQVAVTLDERNAEAHFNLGNVHGKQRNWDDAIRHFRRTLEIDPTFPGAPGRLETATRRKQEEK